MRGRGHGPPIVLGSLVVHNPHNPPHERLLVRLGRVVCRSSSGWVVSFPRRCRRSPSFRCPPCRFVSPVVSCPPSFRVPPRRFVSLPVVSCPPLFCFCPPHRFIVPAIHPARGGGRSVIVIVVFASSLKYYLKTYVSKMKMK